MREKLIGSFYLNLLVNNAKRLFLLWRDRRVTMPKVKLPTANPSKKAGSSKKVASSSGKESSPAKDVSCVAKISNLLTNASEMLHREDDMVSCGENIMRNLVSLLT